MFYYDRKGRLMETAENVFVSQSPNFHENMALAEDENDNCGFIDKDGIWVIEPSSLYSGSRGFQKGQAVVNGIHEGVIDKHGKVIIPVEYGRIEPSEDGFYVVELSMLYGAYDAKGNMIIPRKYDRLNYKGDGIFIGVIGNTRYTITVH